MQEYLGNLDRSFFDPALVFVASQGLLSAILSAWAVPKAFQIRKLAFSGILWVITTLLVSAAVGVFFTGRWPGAMLGFFTVAAITTALKFSAPWLSPIGALQLAIAPSAFILLTPWSYYLLTELGFPGWILTLWQLGVGVGVISATIGMFVNLSYDGLRLNARWRRPREPLTKCTTAEPKVSIHVPCYSEPPDVVCATLKCLSALRYTNFEVIVCDNNTKDENLWRPLSDYCQHLNNELGFERFHFHHVSPLAGAKAGALNYCLQRSAPDADLIVSIDADYQADPDFLQQSVGFFSDPKIGYVQTPHDYRNHHTSSYQQACYCEYLTFQKVHLPSMNEYGAAIITGTMCVIRKRALVDAGGWAEWCLTEDSELSIRLRAVGYECIYLRKTYGRGLIPETFDAYKKQRFRWSAGTVQQLRRHWRLYLPVCFGGPQAMSAYSKLLGLHCGLELLLMGPLAGLGLLLWGLIYRLTANGQLPKVVLPTVFFVAIFIATVTWLVNVWISYRLAGCNSLRDMLRGEIARLSLTYVKMVAGIAGASAKPLFWRRTPKFKATALGQQAFYSTLPETLIGVGLLMLSVMNLLTTQYIGSHLAFLGFIFGILTALVFLCAPLMAVMSERDLRSSTNIAQFGLSHDESVQTSSDIIRPPHVTQAMRLI